MENKKINNDTLKIMFKSIRKVEDENIKTQKYDNKKMIKMIKSIKLHNFMRYKGDNELFFSTDNEKNVTVVLGDNTFGKTTLAQAFRWGLYETLNDTRYNKKKEVVLLNNEAAAELKSGVEKVFVEIVVINQEEEIRFMRTATFNRKNVL